MALNIDFLGAQYTEYRIVQGEPNIRYRWVTYLEPDYGTVTDLCFEVFKKPWFMGFLRKKRWEQIAMTHYYKVGFEHAKYILYGKEEA